MSNKEDVKRQGRKLFDTNSRLCNDHADWCALKLTEMDCQKDHKDSQANQWCIEGAEEKKTEDLREELKKRKQG